MIDPIPACAKGRQLYAHEKNKADLLAEPDLVQARSQMAKESTIMWDTRLASIARHGDASDPQSYLQQQQTCWTQACMETYQKYNKTQVENSEPDVIEARPHSLRPEWE